MISIANGALITRHLIAAEFVGPGVLHSQVIRWKRKPLWLGTAKSKIFRVPVKPVVPMEDTRELMRLQNNYRTYRESIRRYFMAETVQNEVQFDVAILKQTEDHDYARCMELNDEWNKTVAVSREEREAAALEKRKEKVLGNIIAKEKRDAKIMEEIEMKVRKEKAVVHTFITEKNIDQAIEEVLANVVSYNAAIDSEGNRYEGKYEPIAKVPPKTERLQAQQQT